MEWNLPCPDHLPALRRADAGYSAPFDVVALLTGFAAGWIFGLIFYGG
jgi:hypothetical protein